MRYVKTIKKILIPMIAIAGLCLIILSLVYADYYRDRQNSIEIKSRHTFFVNIDGNGNAVTEGKTGKGVKADVSELSLETIAHTWLKEFTDQFTQKYLVRSKGLKDVDIGNIEVLNQSESIVLVEFSAELKNQESDYFSSWDGVIDKGRIICEWVIQFSVDAVSENLAEVHITSVQSSEDYGLETYNADQKNIVESETKEIKTEKELYIYEIKNQVLSVSYDGGEKSVDVPVDFENVMAGQSDKSKLSSGSYVIGLEKTAFLYGGTTVNNKKIPLTIIFSDNKGVDWVSAQISDLTGVNYYYVNFSDQKNGIIIIGYDKTEEQESSTIYVTSDGGENWEKLGSGPTTNVIKEVNFIDDKIGFFSYEYVEGMDSNLYMTRDGGKTFSKITLEAQTLDSTGDKNNGNQSVSGASASISSSDVSSSKLQWSDVFKEALVPTLDSNGILTLYVTQGKNGTYNDGKTVARYQSSDYGVTWKYAGQVEKNAQK